MATLVRRNAGNVTALTKPKISTTVGGGVWDRIMKTRLAGGLGAFD